MYRYAGISGEEVGRSEWDRVKLKSFYPFEGPFMGVSYNLFLFPLVFILVGLFLYLYEKTHHSIPHLPRSRRQRLEFRGLCHWQKERKGAKCWASLIGNIVERAGASSLSLSPSGRGRALGWLLTTKRCPASFTAGSEGTSFFLIQWFASTKGYWG